MGLKVPARPTQELRLVGRAGGRRPLSLLRGSPGPARRAAGLLRASKRSSSLDRNGSSSDGRVFVGWINLPLLLMVIDPFLEDLTRSIWQRLWPIVIGVVRRLAISKKRHARLLILEMVPRRNIWIIYFSAQGVQSALGARTRRRSVGRRERSAEVKKAAYGRLC